jgi:UDP-N-acetylglucosamine acyltransferase
MSESLIHPTAIIDPAAKIGEGTRIGPYAIIGPRVTIGAQCQIDAHVVIQGPTNIGDGNHFYQFTSIGADPQDKKFHGEETWLEIGHRNIFREFATVNRGTGNDRSLTRVGSDNLFLAYTHIAHDCEVGSHVVFSNNASIAGHVTVGDYAILGGFALVHQFCYIGSHAFLGMGCACNQDVPDFVMAVGAPAKPKGINSEGLKRRGFTTGQVRTIRLAYKLLYRNQMSFDEAIESIAQLEDPEGILEPMLETLRNSERGIIR